jgi:hypothetical protein
MGLSAGMIVGGTEKEELARSLADTAHDAVDNPST